MAAYSMNTLHPYYPRIRWLRQARVLRVQYSKLTTYLEDGHIEIDGNKAENLIHPRVIKPKHFLFSKSPPEEQMPEKVA